MSTAENKSRVRQLFESWDRGDETTANALQAQDYIAHLPGVPAPLDRETSNQFFRMFYEAFPDLRHTIEDQVAEGDKVVTRFTARGTHRGPFQGIPPTGVQVTVVGIYMARLSDGKIVEGWPNIDSLGMLQQLGVIPSTQESPA